MCGNVCKAVSLTEIHQHAYAFLIACFVGICVYHHKNKTDFNSVDCRVIPFGVSAVGHALADSQFLHQLCGHAAEILLAFRSAYTIVSNIFRRQHYRTGHIHG